MIISEIIVHFLVIMKNIKKMHGSCVKIKQKAGYLIHQLMNFYIQYNISLKCSYYNT